MFCPKCGSQNQDSSVFCKECGTSLQQQQGGNAAAATAASGGQAVAQAAGQVANQAAKAINNVPGMDKLAKKNKKLPIIIAAVVAVVIIALVIFGLTQCLGGGGLKPGTYTISSMSSSSSSNNRSFVVNKDNTITYNNDGVNEVYTYKKTGSQDGSNLYDLQLKSSNGIEVQYDKDGYITNGSMLPNSSYSASLPTKQTTTLMIPKGATNGKVEGDWGISVVTSNVKETYYSVSVGKVNQDGTIYGVGKSGYDVNVPNLKYDDIVAVSSGSPSTAYWKQANSNSYIVSSDSSFADRYSFVITMPQ